MNKFLYQNVAVVSLMAQNSVLNVDHLASHSSSLHQCSPYLYIFTETNWIFIYMEQYHFKSKFLQNLTYFN